MTLLNIFGLEVLFTQKANGIAITQGEILQIGWGLKFWTVKF